MTTTLRMLDAEVEAASADVRREYLESRKSLHLAGNNRPPVPDEPCLYGIHKAVVDDDSKDILRTMLLWTWNVDHGMPWEEAVRPLRRIEAFMAHRYARKHARVERTRSLVGAILHEQTADNAFDVHELRVVNNQKCPDIARAALDACRAQLRSTREAEAALEAHVVKLTVETTQRPYSVRRADRRTLVRA